MEMKSTLVVAPAKVQKMKGLPGFKWVDATESWSSFLCHVHVALLGYENCRAVETVEKPKSSFTTVPTALGKRGARFAPRFPQFPQPPPVHYFHDEV